MKRDKNVMMDVVYELAMCQQMGLKPYMTIHVCNHNAERNGYPPW